jgi:acyl-CoA synthetase (AMP-forming)/AMP-acid ligase II
VTTDELARLLESGDGVHVVDVRAPDQVALGRVEPVPAGRFHAVPGARLLESAVREYLRGRLAGFKIPKVVRFETELPREDNGKIYKRRISDPYWRATGRRI